MLNTVVLVLVLAMPGNAPDTIARIDMDSIEQCWKEAEAFVVAQQEEFFKVGGLGVAAACEVHAAKRQELRL